MRVGRSPRGPTISCCAAHLAAGENALRDGQRASDDGLQRVGIRSKIRHVRAERLHVHRARAQCARELVLVVFHLHFEFFDGVGRVVAVARLLRPKG